ncbi:hypothetical protein CABS03_10833 [Colletotrichum abscissum]|uniref:Uncharacterized protein n=1 Tax=Colletotrichum abscissum TaxID=1671311 RepID=A0A9P9XPD4_9PEZI|nr:hypothetical protein CABS02_02054 [Colletotrichum abscissum]
MARVNDLEGTDGIVHLEPILTSHQDAELENEDVNEDELFTVFTKWQKHWISLSASFSAMFSTMSSYIYYPAIVPISRNLKVSVSLINLTVTSYLIIAAIAPAFMGDMADQTLTMLFFFPETQRNIVGNGSANARGIYWSFLTLINKSPQRKNGGALRSQNSRRHWPNPFACLPILKDRSSLVVILLYGITYSVKMTLQTSLGAQCLEIYKLDYLTAGLIYIPSGVAGGTLLTDLNCERSATAQGASSIVRCLGAGAAIAALQPLADAAGLGWCFAIYALFLATELPLAWIIRKKGPGWRKQRRP